MFKYNQFESKVKFSKSLLILTWVKWLWLSYRKLTLGFTLTKYLRRNNLW